MLYESAKVPVAVVFVLKAHRVTLESEFTFLDDGTVILLVLLKL